MRDVDLLTEAIKFGRQTPRDFRLRDLVAYVAAQGYPDARVVRNRLNTQLRCHPRLFAWVTLGVYRYVGGSARLVTATVKEGETNGE